MSRKTEFLLYLQRNLCRRKSIILLTRNPPDEVVMDQIIAWCVRLDSRLPRQSTRERLRYRLLLWEKPIRIDAFSLRSSKKESKRKTESRSHTQIVSFLCSQVPCWNLFWQVSTTDFCRRNARRRRRLASASTKITSQRRQRLSNRRRGEKASKTMTKMKTWRTIITIEQMIIIWMVKLLVNRLFKSAK